MVGKVSKGRLYNHFNLKIQSWNCIFGKFMPKSQLNWKVVHQIKSKRYVHKNEHYTPHLFSYIALFEELTSIKLFKFLYKDKPKYYNVETSVLVVIIILGIKTSCSGICYFI